MFSERKNKMEKYIIIQAVNLLGLETHARAKVSIGYIPVGGIGCTKQPQGYDLYYQSMVLKEVIYPSK